MRGVYYNKAGDPSLSARTADVLARNAGFDVMRQKVLPGAPMWMEPSDDSGMFEIIIIIKGSITALDPDRGEIRLEVGDSMYFTQMKNVMQLRADEESEILYIANRPVAEMLLDFQASLNELMDRVDENDHYTRDHCRRVMRYAVQIMRELGYKQENIDKLGLAALFHDVGKCAISGEILRKNGRLTDDEMTEIKKHPLNSRKLLEPQFGHEIAEIAQGHHERLDGSGYPLGLRGTEIPFEAQIIAVADSFDAMTTIRPYRAPVSYLDAAAELADMKDKYAAEVSEALYTLIREGRLESDS